MNKNEITEVEKNKNEVTEVEKSKSLRNVPKGLKLPTPGKKGVGSTNLTTRTHENGCVIVFCTIFVQS